MSLLSPAVGNSLFHKSPFLHGKYVLIIKHPPCEQEVQKSLPPQFSKVERGSGIQNMVLYSKEDGSNVQV